MTKREKFVEWIADYIILEHEHPAPNNYPGQIHVPLRNGIWLDSEEFKNWIMQFLLDAIKDCPEDWLEQHIYNHHPTSSFHGIPNAKQSNASYAAKQTPSPYNSNPMYPYSITPYKYTMIAAEKLKKAIDDSILDNIQNTIMPKLIIEGNANTELLKSPDSNEIQRYSK